MAIINNPFIVGGYLSHYYFCDRETETEQLIRNITNGRNVVIARLHLPGDFLSSSGEAERGTHRYRKRTKSDRSNFRKVYKKV